MTLTAVKLVRVDRKSHREEKREQRKSARRPSDRPPARNHDSNTSLGFQPEG